MSVCTVDISHAMPLRQCNTRHEILASRAFDVFNCARSCVSFCLVPQADQAARPGTEPRYSAVVGFLLSEFGLKPPSTRWLFGNLSGADGSRTDCRRVGRSPSLAIWHRRAIFRSVPRSRGSASEFVTPPPFSAAGSSPARSCPAAAAQIVAGLSRLLLAERQAARGRAGRLWCTGHWPAIIRPNLCAAPVGLQGLRATAPENSGGGGRDRNAPFLFPIYSAPWK